MQHIAIVRFFRPSFLFGLGAATCRMVVQQGVETRYQILTWWVIAACYEASQRQLRPLSRAVRFVLSAAAIAFAAALVKIYLEGIPWAAIDRI